MTDTALIVEGLIVQVWRETDASSVPAPEGGELRAFPRGEAVCGMIWDGQALTAPEPEPRRPVLPKSVVQARLSAIGKLAPAVAWLLANDLEAFARWTAADWPNVYRDDPALLYVLGEIGCTEAEIAAVTAAPRPVGVERTDRPGRAAERSDLRPETRAGQQASRES